jgi:hypothetical protein
VRRSKRETAYEIVGLHLAELLAKHLRRNAGHCAPQLAESVRPIGESLEEHRLPPALDDADGGVERTARTLLRAAFPLCYGRRPSTCKYPLVTCLRPR